jgi:hypothetical protein
MFIEIKQISTVANAGIRCRNQVRGRLPPIQLVGDPLLFDQNPGLLDAIGQ